MSTRLRRDHRTGNARRGVKSTAKAKHFRLSKNVDNAKVILTPQKELAAEWVEITSLKPWDRNPRRRDDANISRVVESIKRFGFAAPILARRADSEVIAGHTRLKAAETLGITRVPVRYLDLDPADAHLLALADNRLNELGSWDDERLIELLSEIRQQGDGVALVAGWHDAEIDGLLKSTADAPMPTEFKEYDESVAEDVKTVSCPHCGGTVPV